MQIEYLIHTKTGPFLCAKLYTAVLKCQEQTHRSRIHAALLVERLLSERSIGLGEDSSLITGRRFIGLAFIRASNDQMKPAPTNR